ncbi:MAG: hypothetical protein QOF51_578 [Chloroflexota bacterium]|jgi:hypothetical protein|nr:hypothetical protein [Chloroflexota bacterium]
MGIEAPMLQDQPGAAVRQPGVAPTISVVVPVHNGGEALIRCLTAITSVADAPLACIVVDDALNNDSAGIARCPSFSVPAC